MSSFSKQIRENLEIVFTEIRRSPVRRDKTSYPSRSRYTESTRRDRVIQSPRSGILAHGQLTWREHAAGRSRPHVREIHPHAGEWERSACLPHVQRPRELELAPGLARLVSRGSARIVRRNVVKQREEKRVPRPGTWHPGDERIITRRGVIIRKVHTRERAFAEGDKLRTHAWC